MHRMWVDYFDQIKISLALHRFWTDASQRRPSSPLVASLSYILACIWADAVPLPASCDSVTVDALRTISPAINAISLASVRPPSDLDDTSHS